MLTTHESDSSNSLIIYKNTRKELIGTDEKFQLLPTKSQR